MEQAPVLGEQTIEIERNPEHPARRATLSLRAMQVIIEMPRHHKSAQPCYLVTLGTLLVDVEADPGLSVTQVWAYFSAIWSKLYEEGLELLFEQWDKSQEIERDEIYRDLPMERRLELLSYPAIKKFEQKQYVLFEQEEIEGYIAEFLGIGQRKSRSVLKAIESQHGLLIERSHKVRSFSHLTFQEYLPEFLTSGYAWGK